MRKKNIINGDYWYDLETGAIENRPNEFHQNCATRLSPKLHIVRDIEPYKSPLGTGVVSSRRERREEMKRHNCREVDTSEWRAGYTNARFAQKHGLKMRDE